MVREKIRASQLINALEDHVLGGGKQDRSEMKQTQVTAALGLLKKCIPDLKSTEHEGELKIEFPTDVSVNVHWPKDKD